LGVLRGGVQIGPLGGSFWGSILGYSGEKAHAGASLLGGFGGPFWGKGGYFIHVLGPFLGPLFDDPGKRHLENVGFGGVNVHFLAENQLDSALNIALFKKSAIPPVVTWSGDPFLVRIVGFGGLAPKRGHRTK
jgi:hypothetical protein